LVEKRGKNGGGETRVKVVAVRGITVIQGRQKGGEGT
jgi:hypothetical protein